MRKIENNYVELEDIKIAYSECGKGTNLILIHGNSGNKRHFIQYQKKYFSMFHTYALDSRGHGKSISTDTDLSIEQISIDIIKFCEKLDIKKANVIGYSDGGNIALHLAKRAPSVFPKIVAISPNYLVSGMTDNSIKLLKNFYTFFKILKSIGIDTRKAIMRFDLMFRDIGLSKNDFENIKSSILFLYAEKDMIKEEHIWEMKKIITDSTMKKIMRCNHLSITSKKETLRLIKKYLE